MPFYPHLADWRANPLCPGLSQLCTICTRYKHRQVMPTTLLVLVRNTSVVLEASDCLSAPCYVVGNLLADFHRYHTRGRLGASPVRCDMFTLILMGNISIIGQVGKLCLIAGLFFPPPFPRRQIGWAKVLALWRHTCRGHVTTGVSPFTSFHVPPY